MSTDDEEEQKRAELKARAGHLKSLKERGEAKPDDATWGDWMLDSDPDKPISHRHETLAHLAASGVPNQQIAKDLGLTQGRVSVLLKNTKISERVRNIQQTYWGGNIEKRFKAAVPLAMDVMEDTIKDEQEKQQLRVDAAKWILEKVTGKATQRLETEDTTLGTLIDKLDEMKSKGEILDITPGKVALGIQPGSTEPEPEADKHLDWVTAHIPASRTVGQVGKDKDNVKEDEDEDESKDEE